MLVSVLCDALLVSSLGAPERLYVLRSLVFCMKNFVLKNLHRFEVVGYISFGLFFGVGFNVLGLISVSVAVICDFLVSSLS